MWSIEYPYDRFTEKIANKTFSKKQKLNHFPGINFLTNKRTLSLIAKSKYILSGFRIPEEKTKLIKFAKNNPNAQFVVKNFDNRGVSLVPFEKILTMNLGSKK